MKKLTMALAVGALTLSMAGLGSAASVEVNIYGASAQVDFWSGLASAYLGDAVNGAGCGASTNLTVDTTKAAQITKDGNPGGVYYHGAKYFVLTAAGPCTNIAGVGAGDHFTIRATGYDSADGVQAVLGNANPIDVMQCAGGNRTQLISVAGGDSPANLGCFPVHLGSADVNGTTLIQRTQGQLDGTTPAAGTKGNSLLAGGTAGPIINVDLGNFVAAPAAVDTCHSGTLIDNHPFIVPFGFFANTGAVAVGDGLLAANLTNVTQAMAQQIFSGNVTDWHTFFPAIPANTPINVCMRVAGSGPTPPLTRPLCTRTKLEFPCLPWTIQSCSTTYTSTTPVRTC